MRAKYIVIYECGLECMVIFPEIMTHKHVACKLIGYTELKLKEHVLSAGFLKVSINGYISCSDRSESMDIDSRPSIDRALARKLLEGS